MYGSCLTPSTPTETTCLLPSQGFTEPTSSSSTTWRQGPGGALDLSCREHPVVDESTHALLVTALQNAMQDARLEENASQRQTWSSQHYFSLTLENTGTSGSVACDHLASERTFLAYMQTSLAIVSTGVALVQLFPTGSASGGTSHMLNTYVRPLGASEVAVGLCTIFIGAVRYFSVQTALRKGSFPVSRLAIGFIATLLAALVSLTFGIMLAGNVGSQTTLIP